MSGYGNAMGALGRFLPLAVMTVEHACDDIITAQAQSLH